MNTVNIVSGMSGSGKSVVASMLAEETGAELLRTDVIRLGLTAAERALRKTPEGILLVYRVMMEQARALLQAEKSVVLDGTFLTQEQRDLGSALAAETAAALRVFIVECPDAIAEQRILERARKGQDPSEAGVEVRRLQQKVWEPPVGKHFRIDASGTIESLREQLQKILRA